MQVGLYLLANPAGQRQQPAAAAAAVRIRQLQNKKIDSIQILSTRAHGVHVHTAHSFGDNCLCSVQLGLVMPNVDSILSHLIVVGGSLLVCFAIARFLLAPPLLYKGCPLPPISPSTAFENFKNKIVQKGLTRVHHVQAQGKEMHARALRINADLFKFGTAFRMRRLPVVENSDIFIHVTDYKLARTVLLGDKDKGLPEGIKKQNISAFNMGNRNVGNLFTYVPSPSNSTLVFVFRPINLSFTGQRALTPAERKRGNKSHRRSPLQTCFLQCRSWMGRSKRFSGDSTLLQKLETLWT